MTRVHAGRFIKLLVTIHEVLEVVYIVTTQQFINSM